MCQERTWAEIHTFDRAFAAPQVTNVASLKSRVTSWRFEAWAEVLDRNVIVAEPELAAHGLEVGLFHGLAHCFLSERSPFVATTAELISVAAS
jgi:hypothetical protein